MSIVVAMSMMVHRWARNGRLPSRSHRRRSRRAKEDTLAKNYVKNGLLLDPNKSLGRNKHMTEVQEQAHFVHVSKIKDGKVVDMADDDELRAVNNLMRKTGKALPKRLTSHQKQILERLMAKHGEDVVAMAKDIKLNTMQHSEGQLKALLESYNYWGKDEKSVDFRVPKKGLW